jgi:hypothetical protein
MIITGLPRAVTKGKYATMEEAVTKTVALYIEVLMQHIYISHIYIILLL